METKTLQTEVDKEVRERAEELAKEKVRSLTLRRRQLKAIYHRTKAGIEEVDKKIAEIKIADFEEDALRAIACEPFRLEFPANLF